MGTIDSKQREIKIMAFITSQEVKEIRTQLKKALGKEWKLSITGGNTSTLKIRVVSGPVEMPKDYLQVQHYSIEQNFKKYDRADLIETFNTIKKIAMAGHWDESDSRTDYFNCFFYVKIEGGNWTKPYINNKADIAA